MSSYIGKKIKSIGDLELKSRNGSILHKSAVEHEQAVTFSHADDAHLASLKSLSLSADDLIMHDGTNLASVAKTTLLSGLATESYVDSAVAGVAPLISSVDLPLSVNSGVLSVELGDLLSQSLAESTYLAQADAATTYLSQADAQTTYLAQADQFITSIVEPSQLSVVGGVLNVNLDDYVSTSLLSTTLADYATTAYVGTEVETAVDGLASISYVDSAIAGVDNSSSVPYSGATGDVDLNDQDLSNVAVVSSKNSKVIDSNHGDGRWVIHKFYTVNHNEAHNYSPDHNYTRFIEDVTGFERLRIEVEYASFIVISGDEVYATFKYSGVYKNVSNVPTLVTGSSDLVYTGDERNVDAFKLETSSNQVWLMINRALHNNQAGAFSFSVKITSF